MASSNADIFNANALQLMRAGDYHSAYRWLRQALAADPDDRHSLNNMASTLKQLGREAEALPIYETLTEKHPDFLAPFNNLAFSYLRLSRYEEGWKMYRHRLAANKGLMDHRNPVTGRLFNEEDLPAIHDIAGKDLIVVPEQGLGDELFFLRFLPHLIGTALVGRAWYAPTPKFFPVARSLDIPSTLTDMSFAAVPKDNAVAVSLADLPLLCGHNGMWFPPSLRFNDWVDTAYYALRDDERKKDDFQPSIGVTWRAGNRELVHRGGISKALDPEAVGWALRDDPRRVVVMQRGLHPKELDALKKGLGHDRVDVFEQEKLPAGKELLAVCARLSGLDAYVGVSNTNMHLMAALGRTARVLVIHPAEWRWPVKEERSSPWFPGFTTYRQTTLGWEAALTALHDDLASEAAASQPAAA